jgi:hypothetical protein
VGNIPFYIVEHKREKILYTKENWDNLFDMAEFEFDDMVEVNSLKGEDSARNRAR